MINTAPKISVIMPTYNGAKFIRKSINSVLSQTFENFELVIVDDASIDNTVDIVRSYKNPRVKLIRRRKNGGTSCARNTGIKKSTGEYIAYCDHDDIYHNRHLEVLAEYLDKHPDVGLAYADAVWIKKGAYRKTMYSIDFDKNLLETGNYITPINAMHRRSCMEKAGLFDESPIVRKHALEDWDMWMRMSDHYKFAHVKISLAKYIMHSKNRSLGLDFVNSYYYVVKKRLSKLKSKDDWLNYIRKYSICTVMRLGVRLKTEKAKMLADKFSSITTNFNTLTCIGICCMLKGKIKTAHRLFERARKNINIPVSECDKWDKKNIAILEFYRARTYHLLGNPKKALRIYKKIPKIDLSLAPGDRSINVNTYTALCHFELANYREAMRLLKDVKKAYVVNNLRGLVYCADRKYQLAKDEFRMALKLTPLYTTAWYNLNTILNKLSNSYHNPSNHLNHLWNRKRPIPK